MKASILLLLSPLTTLAAATPAWYDRHLGYPLEGYARDNPIGRTTGGQNGRIFTVTTDTELATALKSNSSSKIIYLDGTFHPTSQLLVGSNTSLLGKGKGANIIGKGLNIYNATNVIVRNIGVRFVAGGDAMALQNSTRVWIDHCEFESELSVDVGPDYYVSVALLEEEYMLTVKGWSIGYRSGV